MPADFTCGRGGTGRRAALRSLWPKGRGSSSLLDRTKQRRQGNRPRGDFGVASRPGWWPRRVGSCLRIGPILPTGFRLALTADMIRAVILYGLVLAVLGFALEWLEYRHFVRSRSEERRVGEEGRVGCGR